ncbi:hypothetical protein M2372_003955 [Chryseobacterium sp. BIGb0232]|nr:hypothetical protein [Chryseobacterium sp. BIGb0232]ROS14382.1 hypothetical protein EDF65_3157 [Chryseobacterium nakagawai]
MVILFIITIILIVLQVTNRNIWGVYLLNYFFGIMIMIILQHYEYKGVYLGQGGGTLIMMFYIFYFSILFFGSLLYWMDKDNRKVYYFVVPVIIYFLLVMSLFSDKGYSLWGILFLAFFPTHLYSYFTLKKLGRL